MPFNWVVALDARGDCRGALEFAKWLAAPQPDSDSSLHHFYGVHVPGSAHAGGDGDARALTSDAQVQAVVTSAGADALFQRMVSTEANLTPSEMLADLDPNHAAGLVVARRADADGPSLIRLGGTVRRIAETTSTPVVIAPHDLERTQIGHGPILVAVDPRSTPSDAARFALHLARSRGLRVLLVNVAHVETVGVLSSGTEALQDAYGRAEREANADLQAWAYDHGLASAWRAVVRGDVRFAIQSVAQRHDASLIVCGTRQRSILERLLEPSRALELARYARRPVVLVPNSMHEADPDDERLGMVSPFTWARATQ